MTRDSHRETYYFFFQSILGYEIIAWKGPYINQNLLAKLQSQSKIFFKKNQLITINLDQFYVLFELHYKIVKDISSLIQ